MYEVGREILSFRGGELENRSGLRRTWEPQWFATNMRTAVVCDERGNRSGLQRT